MAYQLLATTLPGIGKLAQKYLKHKYGKFINSKELFGLRNNDLLTFGFDGDLSELLQPAMLEDIYLSIANINLDGAKHDLSKIKQIVSSLKIMWPEVLPHKHKHQYSIRVVVQAPDSNWRQYRRLEIKEAVELGIKRNRYSKFKQLEDNADFELWVQQVGQKLLISLRLSDKTLRHRDYKFADYPGSLRPTIANAMVMLSNPQPSDVFLDPMCGAGTIIIERALSGRYEQLLAFDKNYQAIEATLINLGKKHKPWVVKQADATKLPLSDKSVDAIVTNPPWGVQMEVEVGFYKSILQEFKRVLKTEGRVVMLLKQGVLPKELFAELGFQLHSTHKNILILGQRAEIVVLVNIY